MSHYDETKNRFNPQNRFIGDIEDGKRYPFACYTKEESDERYARKSVETDVTALAEAVNSKASQADLTALAAVVATKASQTDLTALSNTVNTKADESECVAIRARLDALEYVSIDISSLTANPNLCELGSSNTISVAWALNKAATGQELNGTPVAGNTKQFTSVAANQSYTLEVTDGQTSDNKTVNVSFANQIYYGVAANLNNVTALSKVLSNDKTRTITVTAGTGQYIIYAIPSRLGNVSFYVGGFEGGFEDPVEQTLTNASGYQETYRVYRSTNANLGNITVEIREA
jgi:hypothetical protein